LLFQKKKKKKLF